jgi:hypothetical protein
MLETKVPARLVNSHSSTFYRTRPDIDLASLQASFNFVPHDDYWGKGSRYRTTSRVRITKDGLRLMEKRPLYQPSYVNKLDGYGAIDRDYANAPVSLIESQAFAELIESWISRIPLEVETFSVHQIRTTDNGCPTPEGRHIDGTDWSGVYILNRHNIARDSAVSTFWDRKDNIIFKGVVEEGELLTFFDSHYSHATTNLRKVIQDEPSYRDVFVLTIPEHGVNREQEAFRAPK